MMANLLTFQHPPKAFNQWEAMQTCLDIQESESGVRGNKCQSACAKSSLLRVNRTYCASFRLYELSFYLHCPSLADTVGPLQANRNASLAFRWR